MGYPRTYQATKGSVSELVWTVGNRDQRDQGEVVMSVRLINDKKQATSARNVEDLEML